MVENDMLHFFDEENHERRLRVASYCRVSTDDEIQIGSLENQMIHYSNYIRSNKTWHLAGIYADRGKTGTKTNGRIGFNKMIQNALAGEIDLILCKSISRFSRNITDTLEVIKLLDQEGVVVYFEKENIETGNMVSFFLLTILAAFAEEESRSISENMNWSFTKRFEKGEVLYRRLLGYGINHKKEWVILEQEAMIVKEAFSLFLEGVSMSEIARIFIRKSYKKSNGRTDWSNAAIKRILTNEKYIGDVLSRKTFTKNYLSHTIVINKGEKPQYYIGNHHEGIISREDFLMAQTILSYNKSSGKRGTRNQYPFSSRLCCARCGGNLQRFKNNDGKVTWRCGNHVKSNQLCRMRGVKEIILEEVLKKAFYQKYNINTKYNQHLTIKNLIAELEYAEISRECDENLLILELEKIQIDEMNATLSDCERELLLKKRITIERKIADRSSFWESFDSDSTYRENALLRLNSFGQTIYNINKVFDLSFLRAWVIRITIEPPFLFVITWIDYEESKVNGFF